MTAASSSSSDALLMRFQPTDTATKISRATLIKLAQKLGYQRESEVLHYAALKLANDVLPTYEPDDGPLTAKQMAAIKKAVPQNQLKSVKASLFD